MYTWANTFRRISLSDIVYTRSFVATGSSFIDEAYLNENTGDLYVDLSDKVYLYKNVSTECFEKFRQAGKDGGSYGAYYRLNIKPVYGPSQFLGDCGDLEYDRVEVDAPVTQGGAITTNYPAVSLYTSSDVVTSLVPGEEIVSSTAAPNSVFSLRPFSEPKVEGVQRPYEIVFDAPMGERKYSTTASSLDDAVASLYEIARMLDVTFTAKAVTVSLV